MLCSQPTPLPIDWLQWELELLSIRYSIQLFETGKKWEELKYKVSAINDLAFIDQAMNFQDLFW